MSPQADGDNPLESERTKRPVDDTWQEGHHSAKSVKSNERQIAPQVQQTVAPRSSFRSHHRYVSRQSSASAADPESITRLESDRTPTPTPTPTPTASRTPTPSLQSLFSQTGSSSRESTPRLQLGGHPDAPNSLAIPGIPIGQQPSFLDVMRFIQKNPLAVNHATNTASQAVAGSSCGTPTGVGRQELPIDSTSALGSIQTDRLAGVSHHEFNFELPLGPTGVDSDKHTQIDAQSKGKGKAQSKSTFTLPPWPTQGAPTYNADPLGVPSASQPHITPSTSSRPLPDIPLPNPKPQGAEGCAENALGSVMSFFSTGMVHFFSAVRQSNESSHKLVQDALDEFRRDLREREGKQTTSNEDQSQYIQLSENLFVPARPRTKKKRTHREAIKSKEDLVPHHRFTTAIRQHSLRLLGITDYKYLSAIKCTLTEEEDDAFNLDDPGHIELSTENFMVDCTRPADSTFNSAAIDIFTNDFIDKVQTGMWYSHAEIPPQYLEPEMTKSAFRDHLTYIRRCHRRFVVMPLEDAVAAKIAETERLRKSSRSTRKTRLLKIRLEAMADDPRLERHIPLIQYLGTQAMSSDESENERRRTINYPRVYPRWRSPQLAALLWQADAVSEMHRARPIGRRKQPGTQQRVRPHSSKYNENAPAPACLPRNCYNPDWLLGLTEKSKKELKAQDQEYDFVTTSEGEESETVANPGARPQSANPTIAGDDVVMRADNEES